MWIKHLYVILGIILVIIGFIGIIVPGLPTTIFLLLAAKLFYHGNRKFHDWLLNTKILGSYIREYNEKQGMDNKQKYRAIIIMGLMISISLFFLKSPYNWIVLSLGFVGAACIIYIVPKAKSIPQ
ncbi:MAG: YbaN family protein [Saprospiraceae bacterium]